jgi:thiol-disulfide isomerase/thioredoxin
MSSSWVLVVAVLIAAFGVAFIVGRLLTLRSGLMRAAADAAPLEPEAAARLGLSQTGPTVVHFTAVWCGPCAAVRRVVDQVCADLPAVTHVEVDMDDDPDSARRLSVLSLPTTFVFDAEGRQRFRASGVPTVADLRAALEPLLA